MTFIESETIELKSSVVADLCKEVIAFANTRGGTLYIGVEDNGTVIGVDSADRVTLQINNMVRDSIKPDITMFVHYETQVINDKQIIAVTVQEGTDRPYYLGSKGLKPSGVYVRNGTSTDPASDTAIRKMIKETDGDSFETMRSLEQNLSFQAAEAQFAKRKVPYDAAKMQTLGMVSSDDIYSNVALLLSEQCPSTIKAATFAGVDQSVFQDRREFTGSLFQQMEDLYAYLDLHNQTKATFEGLYRTDTKDYPEDALRETLMNSLVHRDYSFSGSTFINLYSDRLEFISLGGLVPGLSLEAAMLGASQSRNEKLANLFYRMKLIEAYGTGISKIISCYKGKSEQPVFESVEGAFQVILPNVHARNLSMEDAKYLPILQLFEYKKKLHVLMLKQF